jgi:hypothetical protein
MTANSAQCKRVVTQQNQSKSQIPRRKYFGWVLIFVHNYPEYDPVLENSQKITEYYLSHRQQRNDQILAALKQSIHEFDPNEITKIVYMIRKTIFI